MALAADQNLSEHCIDHQLRTLLPQYHHQSILAAAELALQSFKVYELSSKLSVLVFPAMDSISLPPRLI